MVTEDQAPEGLARSRLASLVSAAASSLPIGVVYPCDVPSMQAAVRLAALGLAQPVLIGPRPLMTQAADAAQASLTDFDIIDASNASSAARRGTELARNGAVAALMKGSLHTDELLRAVVSREADLRGPTRISHVFLFDLPRYHKLLALADCVVNVSPTLTEKRDILHNAIVLLHAIGVACPKVAIVAAVETIDPSMPATLDAAALVQMSARGQLPAAVVDGPFGFDNAISAESARQKGIVSSVAGDPDLILVPDLQCGNVLYKSFTYIGGGACAGVVLGARVPIALSSRADGLETRVASAALAVKLALARRASA